MARDEQLSDDDAPEEVTLAEGKAQVEARRALETRSKLAAAAAAKAKRQIRETRRLAAAAESINASRPTEQEAVGSDGYALDANQEDADLLPEAVLHALEQHGSERLVARPAVSSALQDHAIIKKLDKPKLLAKKRKKVEQLTKGPVVVQVLGAIDKLAAGTASCFLKEHLVGGRHKRSADMLNPTTCSGGANRQAGSLMPQTMGPAKKFL
ncbi:hypothetical protein V8C86DRAFT_3024508 [Haematococcus lacustris]